MAISTRRPLDIAALGDALVGAVDQAGGLRRSLRKGAQRRQTGQIFSYCLASVAPALMEGMNTTFIIIVSHSLQEFFITVAGGLRQAGGVVGLGEPGLHRHASRAEKQRRF